MEWFARVIQPSEQASFIQLDFAAESDVVAVLPLLVAFGELRLAKAKPRDVQGVDVDLVAIVAGPTVQSTIDRVRGHRAQRASVAIVVIGEECCGETELSALRAGADDCIALPVSAELFRERVRALLRRASSVARARSSGSMELENARRLLRVEDAIFELSPTEYRLIGYLFQRAESWINTSELHTEVLGAVPRYDSSAVRVHISNIRRKLGAAAWCLCTQRGRGIKLTTQKLGLGGGCLNELEFPSSVAL